MGAFLPMLVTNAPLPRQTNVLYISYFVVPVVHLILESGTDVTMTIVNTASGEYMCFSGAWIFVFVTKFIWKRISDWHLCKQPCLFMQRGFMLVHLRLICLKMRLCSLRVC